jgi:hypothetical protein
MTGDFKWGVMALPISLARISVVPPGENVTTICTEAGAALASVAADNAVASVPIENSLRPWFMVILPR